MSKEQEEIEKLTEAALAEAQSAGLPPGWKVTFIGKVRRKKWFCPEKKGYDSLKKALSAAGVVVIAAAECTSHNDGNNDNNNNPSSAINEAIATTTAVNIPKKKKHGRSSSSKNSNKVARYDDAATAPSSKSLLKQHQQSQEREEEEEQELDNDSIPEVDPEPNPETALDDLLRPDHDPNNKMCVLHWDPNSLEGKLVGCRIRVYYPQPQDAWREGRIVLLDPITRKHKVQFSDNKDHHEWIYLHDPKVTTLQIGTRLVWAHVKGFAWWPGQVMEAIGDNLPASLCNSRTSLLVEFFGSTNQISVIRDTEECIRPFQKGHVDAFMKKKCKKKLNQEAIDFALKEEALMEEIQNHASKQFATKAFYLVNKMAHYYLGKRVQFHRSDVNYPYGETVRGFVRQYSPTTKKWLVDYVLQFAEDYQHDDTINTPFTSPHQQRLLLLSSTTTTTATSSSILSPTTAAVSATSYYRGSGATLHPPSWVNLLNKDIKLKVLSSLSGGTNKQQQQQKQGGGKKRLAQSNIDKFAPSMDDVAAFFKTKNLLKTERCILCLRDVSAKKAAHKDENQQQEAVSNAKIGDHDIILQCGSCNLLHHNSCLDNPLNIRQARKIHDIQRSSTNIYSPNQTTTDKHPSSLWTCDKCYRCEGCNKTDLLFGCKSYSKQVSIITLIPNNIAENSNNDISEKQQDKPKNKVNDSYQPKLCSMCVVRYDDGNYCPYCAKTFDDDSHYTSQKAKLWRRRHLIKQQVLDDNDYEDEAFISKFEDTRTGWCTTNTTFTTTASASNNNNQCWGFGAGTMLTCDGCEKWVHAGCATLSKNEYELITTKRHPIYAGTGEFLCAICCRKKCQSLIEQLVEEDKASMGLFAIPVTEDVAPNYKDVIKNPCDITTLREKFQKNEFSFSNYVWVKEMFELMVYNAMVYNSPNSKYWNEAKRFHMCCIDKIFNHSKAPAAASYRSKYADRIIECAKLAEESLRNEKERVKKDEFAQKKDLVAGAEVASSMMINEGPLVKPIDVSSSVTHMEIRLSQRDAHYTCWLDSCFSCGSTGAPDVMLFCVDCGEAYHSFCCGAPICSMDDIAAIGWRCPNCKLCEISGLCPKDENQIVYCDLCDRAFDIKLLYPRIIGSVPKGLLICDQCVTCSSCDQRKGKRRRCWSQDPNLCHRCGGNNFCIADKKVKTVEKIEKVKKPTRPEERLVSEKDAQLVTELRLKYEEEFKWQTREMWRLEYQSICDDAAKLYSLAKAKNHNHCEQIISHERCLVNKIPSWMRYRSARWMRISSKKFNHGVPPNMKIIALVSRAKLASSFLATGCNYFGVECSSLVKYWQRACSLLVPPDLCGEVRLPEDAVKLVGDHILGESKWRFPDVNDIVAVKVEDVMSTTTSPEVESLLDSQKDCDVKYIKSRDPCKINLTRPFPMKGWDDDEARKWTDPRTCSLCHTCGDDEAGLLSITVGSHGSSSCHEGQLGRVGRLLPISDGAWIHLSCALWSSEVWEGENGILHNVDKARHRGNKMKCFGCGRPGPTLGCSKSNCPVNFHFCCAVYCGAVMTSKQQMFCKIHKNFASQIIPPEEASYEHMKSLRVMRVDGQKTLGVSDFGDNNKPCLRIGSLVVHSLGVVEQHCAGFHTESHITPPGYTATRIFWSFKKTLTRTLYLMKVDRSSKGNPIFSIRNADDPSAVIRGKSVEEAYAILLQLVLKANSSVFASQSDSSSLKPIRREKYDTFGLNGPQFFGFGINIVRKALESSPGVVVVAVPLSGNSQTYKFCFNRPKKDYITDILRQRAAEASEKALANLSGCARTEGIIAVAKSGGAGRITRALVRSADEELSELVGGGDRSSGAKGDEQPTGETKNADKIQAMYQEMKSIPLESRLTAKRSHIHGWGLFTKCDVVKHSMIIEYMGETVRQAVADKRERAYELSGQGSCYMFRLDANRIVDATMIGCMARFMNHCCQPNAYAKIITVETEKVLEKKIVICAYRDILSGEEITYDYKFPVEDGSLKCTCGAPNCIGRMN